MFGVAWLVYLMTAAPDIYWRDSGELTAAAALLGSPHPTGFPLYCMGAKAFTLLPFGTIAFRLNLFSCTAGGACAALSYLLAFRLARSRGFAQHLSHLSGVTAAGLLAAAHIVWRNATVAEVYMPSLALLAAALLLFWRAVERRDEAHEPALALLTGLAIGGLHSTLRFELGMFLAVAWLVAYVKTKSRRLLSVPFFFALGFAVVAYLPLVSAARSVVDWGHPSTFPALWDHLTASRIRQAFSEEIASTSGRAVAQNISFFARQMWDQLLGLAPGLGLLGGASMFAGRKDRPRTAIMAIWLIWIAASSFVYSFWINPMGLEDMQNGFGLILAAAVLAGVGVAAAASFVSGSSHRLAVAAGSVLALMALLPPAASGWHDKIHGRDYSPSAWSRAALDQAGPSSALLVTSDDLSAGLTYLQTTEGARPDLAVVTRQHIWDAEYLATRLQPGVHISADVLSGFLARPVNARKVGRVGMLKEIVEWSSTRGRLLWEPGDEVDAGAAPPLRASTPLFVASQRPAALADSRRAVEKVDELLGDGQGKLTRDMWARHLTACASHAYRQAAKKMRKKTGLARRWLRHAIDVLRRVVSRPAAHPPALLNLGACLALSGEILQHSGEKEAARKLYVAAIQRTAQYRRHRPGRAIGWLNSGRYYLKLAELGGPDSSESLETARSHLLEAESLGPPRAATSFMLGVVAARKGDFARARSFFQRTLQIQPDHRNATLYLKKIEGLSR